MSKMAPHVDVPRIDRLLRSVIGVTDLHFARSGPMGSVTVIHVLRALHVQHHQIVRNIVSALQAAFDIDLEHRHVFVHDTSEGFAAAVAQSGPVPALVDPAPPVIAATEATSAGSYGVRATPRHQGEVAAEANEPAVHLERIDFEQHGVTARCRVQLTLGARSFAAVAEAPDGPTVEAELAARVALDALRAAGSISAELEGVGLITLASTTLVVASVKQHGDDATLAGAAPLVDSIAWSAAAAVLNAAGCAATDSAPVPMPVRRHETRNHKLTS